MINEFRVSTDGTLFAFYDPGNGPWFAPKAPLEEWHPDPNLEGWSIPDPWMQGRFVESDKIDGFGFEWIRFLPADRAAREVLRIVADWAADNPDTGAELIRKLNRRGYTLSTGDEDDD